MNEAKNAFHKRTYAYQDWTTYKFGPKLSSNELEKRNLNSYIFYNVFESGGKKDFLGDIKLVTLEINI